MRMMRVVMSLCLMAAACLAADAAGKWKVVANAPDGNSYHVTLVLKDEGGKLSGVLESDRGQMPLANVSYANGELRFDLMLDMGAIPFRLKVDGDKLSGTLTAPDGSTGSVTGQREAAATSSIAGKWEISATDPDGTPRRATFDLKQDGERITGTVMTENGDALPIAGGKVNGSAFEFKVSIGEGDVVISGKVAGDTVSGEYKIPTGEAGKFTGKRAEAASLAGRWAVVARDAEGNQIRSTLELKVEGDRLSGTLTTESGDTAPLVDGKVQGDTFTFKIYVGDGNIEVKGRLENGKVTGEYVTPNGSKGTYTGTRG
ncbi:MAG: hypothetical protein WHT08_15690 [Bryobacteraceae bacterium]|jgi:hypothetical protein